MSASQYSNLSFDELKALRKVHKANPPALKLVEDAIASYLTHNGGHLKDFEMSTVSGALNSVLDQPNVDPTVVAKVNAALDAIARHKVGYVKPEAPASSPAAPVTTDATPATAGAPSA